MLTATAVAVLVLPAAAGAADKPASRQIRPAVDQEFSVHGTHGFTITVAVHDRRQLTLDAFKESLAISEASYKLPIRPARGSDRIKARIGKLGHVDVRFVPRSIRKKWTLPHGCHGGRSVVEEGHFVGVIAFRGERGYTRARAHHATGTVTRTPAATCHIDRERPLEAQAIGEEGPQVLGLAATARHHRIGFVALRTSARIGPGKGFSASVFLAAGHRQRGRIKEKGVVLDLLVRGADFATPDPLHPTSEAVLRPPAPFLGTATYRGGAARADRWTGDLRVDLPGFGVVPLAGRGTHATMCQGAMCGSALDLSPRLLRRPPAPLR